MHQAAAASPFSRITLKRRDMDTPIKDEAGFSSSQSTSLQQLLAAYRADYENTPPPSSAPQFKTEPTNYSPAQYPSSSQPHQVSPQCLPDLVGHYNTNENTPPPSSAPGSLLTPSGSYRLDFGKHKGNTLEECGQIYIDWLIKNDVAKHRPALRRALAARAPPAFTPSKSAPSRAPLTPISSNIPPSSSATSRTCNDDVPTRLEDYTLSFGRYKGQTLDKCDEKYRDWFLKSDFLAGQSALKAALEGLTGPSPAKLTASIAPSTPVSSSLPPSSSVVLHKDEEHNIPSLSSVTSYKCEIPTEPGDYIKPFGKHSGFSISQIYGSDEAYIYWLAAQCCESDQSTPLLVAASKAKAYLTIGNIDLPPSSSAASSNDKVSSLPPPSSANPYNEEVPVDPGDYRLPFGKHQGSTISDISESHLSYLHWLANQAHEGDQTTPLLLAASKAKAYLKTRNTNPPPSSSAVSSYDNVPALPEDYILPFGKHKGSTISEIAVSNEQYLHWLADQTREEDRSTPLLIAALNANAFITTHNANLPPPSSAVPCNEDALALPEDYILPFGKHKGLSVSQIAESNETYLHWLADQVCEGEQTNPSLIAALEAKGYTTEYNLGLRPYDPSYRSPDLDRAPAVFREKQSKRARCTWITESNAKQYFGIDKAYLGLLPHANPNAAKQAEQATYYLWHVWDIVREHGTKKRADEGRRAFQKKIRSLETINAKERAENGLPARRTYAPAKKTYVPRTKTSMPYMWGVDRLEDMRRRKYILKR